MFIKNIEIVSVENRGLANESFDGQFGVVKRVTVEFDVVTLPPICDDPMKVVHQSMDSQIWFLKQPVIDAVYGT